MNGSIFWRLVWKEYRVQRAFWISMAVLTALLQLVAVTFVTHAAERINLLLHFTLAFPALYALGCGATLFATEHETGTYEFQRSLPVSAWQLFFGKLACAVVSVLALIGLLFCLALLLAGGRLPDGESHRLAWALWGFAAVEGLVWGAFFSLLLKWPLRAAILALVAASFCIHFASAGFGASWELQSYLAALPFRAAIVSVVAMADGWLGYRWFRDQAAVSRVVGRRGPGRAVAEETALTHLEIRPSPVALFGRLLWQQWRQSAGTMAVIGAGVVALAFVGRWVWFTEANVQGDRLEVIVFLAALAAALIGSCVFLADQRRCHFRYFAEHGVRPGQVWLSRQLIWMLPLLLLSVALLPLFFLGNEPLMRLLNRSHDWSHRDWDWYYRQCADATPLIGDANHVGMLFVCVGLAYGSGQLCSMLFRSGVLAGVFGLMGSAVLCGWAALMWFWDVSWWWSVTPIPPVLLLASWLRAHGWMLQRNGLRAWLPVVLVLVVPLAALLTAVPLYRVNSIADVSPGFSPQQFARPVTAEEQQTADMYRRAHDLVANWQEVFPEAHSHDREAEAPKPSATAEDDGSVEAKERPIALMLKVSRYVQANEPAIALMLQASRREACDFFDPRRLESPPYFRGSLLVDSGRVLQAEGKLDEALERYLAALRFSAHLRRRTMWPQGADRVETYVYEQLGRWAAHPQQTGQRIRKALAGLEQITANLPSPSDAIKWEYLWMQRIIAADPSALAAADMKPNDVSLMTLWARWLPWEQARARRLLNRIAARDLRRFQGIERAAVEGRRIPDWGGYPRLHYHTEEIFALREIVNFPSVDYGCDYLIFDLIRDFTEMEARRRAMRLLLALQAWKCERGELPESLDVLVGPHLDRMPVDPFAGEPFRYFPQGVPIPLDWGRWPYSAAYDGPKTLPAEKPFIWSAGWRIATYRSAPDNVVEYSIYYDQSSDFRGTRLKLEIWRQGWLFPLPSAGTGSGQDG